MADTTEQKNVPSPADVAKRMAQKPQDGEPKYDTTLADNMPEDTEVLVEARDEAPWEKNGTEYDAERAATLISNLTREIDETRREMKQAKAERDELLKQRNQGESEGERALRERVASLEEQLNMSNRKAALTAAGISEDFVDLVSGTTADEINASVQRLLKLRGGEPGQVPEFVEPSADSVGDAEVSRGRRVREAFGF